jgi:putative ABC transport system permease protein
MSRAPFHDRLFRWLLRLFPSEFRGDFGDDMRADFTDQRREVEGRPREVRRLWFRTAVDVLHRAPREHLDVLVRDASHGLRLVRRHPVPALTAILSLAIGIGLNSAVFSVVSGVLWRGLPFPESDRLVVVNEFQPSSASPYWISAPAAVELERQAKTLEQMAVGSLHGFNIVEPIEPAQVGCFAVSERFFDALRVAPRLGRAFTPTDYEPSIAHWANQPANRPRFNPVPRVMILGHDAWQRRFLGDAGIVGKRVRLSEGDQVEIVGVMGPEMSTIGSVVPGECWIPEAPDPRQTAGILTAFAHVRAGRSIDEANAELKVISDRLPASPYSKERGTLRAQSVLQRLTDRVRTQLTFLFGAVVCVLLVTCANIVNLFLAHAAGRRDEMATRVALGASRGRLVRQTLTESLLVSSIGGSCGFALAWWGVPVLVALAPADIPRLREIHVDWFTFAFTAMTSCAVGTVCGMLALMPTRSVPRAVFGAVRASLSPRASRFRQGLTVCEIALALMLAVAATLMVRTVRALGAIELGFDPSHVVVADLSLGFTRAELSGRQFQMDVIERVRALPGVRAAGIGLGPLSGGMFMGDVIVPGDARRFSMRVDAVSPGYFEALSTRLVAGRLFEERDVSVRGPEVVLVNEAAVRELWRGASPIGRSIFINQTEALEVIGVVADARGSSLEEAPGPAMYQLSIQSRNFGVGTMLIRVDGDPQTLVPQVRAIIRSLSRNQPFRGVTPLQERIDQSMAPRLFALRLIGLFSVIGLVLAVVGVYGVLAEFVAQRVPEIGVRMAFGATALHILRLILGQGLRLVVAGVFLGVGGAVLLRDAMTTMVYRVGTLDPLAYVLASVFLVIATIAACSIPARRAARLDPAVALRE